MICFELFFACRLSVYLVVKNWSFETSVLPRIRQYLFICCVKFCYCKHRNVLASDFRLLKTIGYDVMISPFCSVDRFSVVQP